jgi:hypothetical protein
LALKTIPARQFGGGPWRGRFELDGRGGVAMNIITPRDQNARQVRGPTEGRRAPLSAKRGDIPKGELKDAAEPMAQSMTDNKLEDFAHTKGGGKSEPVTD